jgi:von Willebrand factor type A domain
MRHYSTIRLEHMRALASSLAALALLSACSANTSRAAEGVAIALVYDTSGSMREAVRDGQGGRSPKYVIGNRALEAVVAKIERFATNGSARQVQAGLFTFSGNNATEVVKFGKFDAAAMRKWLKEYSGPGSGTPLGAALETASRAVLKSDLPQKHVLVITDGMNTAGPDPGQVLPRLVREAERKGVVLFTHFVAFDVAARVFDPLKKHGATVVGAANEKELNGQLDFILEEKILLEKDSK